MIMIHSRRSLCVGLSELRLLVVVEAKVCCWSLQIWLHFFNTLRVTLRERGDRKPRSEISKFFARTRDRVTTKRDDSPSAEAGLKRAETKSRAERWGFQRCMTSCRWSCSLTSVTLPSRGC